MVTVDYEPSTEPLPSVLGSHAHNVALIRVPQGPQHDCWVGGAQSPRSWLHLALPTVAAVPEPPPPGEQKKRPRRPVRPETRGKWKVDSVIQDSVQGVLQGEGGREAVGKMLSTWKGGQACHF